jgi:hypothetical protein
MPISRLLEKLEEAMNLTKDLSRRKLIQAVTQLADFAADPSLIVSPDNSERPTQ